MNCIFSQCAALGLVRILLGATFVLHGSQKVFGLFGGTGLAKFAGWIKSLGYPAWLGKLAAYCELIGGLMLLFGVAAQVGALLVIPVMACAIGMVHLSKGYFIQNGGCEYALNLLILAAIILVFGPGRFALYDLCVSFC